VLLFLQTVSWGPRAAPAADRRDVHASPLSAAALGWVRISQTLTSLFNSEYRHHCRCGFRERDAPAGPRNFTHGQ
jgi:hypothetical protein